MVAVKPKDIATPKVRERKDFLLLTASKMEKVMATHSSTLAWKIPWMEESGRLQSMGSQRIRQD